MIKIALAYVCYLHIYKMRFELDLNVKYQYSDVLQIIKYNGPEHLHIHVCIN